MSFSTTRRGLLGGAALLFAGIPEAAEAQSGTSAGSNTDSFKLGIATYSLRNFSRSGAIKAAKALKIPYVNIKDVHLPLTSTPQEIAAAVREFQREKLTILGGGNVSFRQRQGERPATGEDTRPEGPISDDEMRRNFEYAKLAGMKVMVAAPANDAAQLKKIEKLVKEYDIKFAIHNHGPEDKQFPAPQDVLKAVDGLDPRMGLCLDVGHTARTGTDVVEAVRQAGPRLHDMHIKDLADMRVSKSQVAVGEGAMPVVAIFKQLKKQGYKGGVMLEYEIDEENPVPGMAKSFAYMRGVLAGLEG